jgi:TusA-related sulfurtransferase
MEIDARGLKHPEPLRLLRDALQNQCSIEEKVTILVDSREEAKQVKTFAGFSGHGVEVEETGDHYRIRIDRMCNCG